MKRNLVILAFFSCILHAEAAWYWPFGSDDDENLPTPAELMEPASRFIDAGADFVEEGKIDEAVAEYRKALMELNRIEIENPERVKTPEFATIRNKRAYIESTIDSLLLAEGRRNARAVAVTDTSELERLYADERKRIAEAKANRGKTASDRGKASETSDPELADPPAAQPAAGAKPAAPVKPAASEKPAAGDRRARMMLAREDYVRKDYAAAMLTIRGLLLEKPNDAVALNLKALVEKASGDVKAAEATLGQLIQSNPKFVYGYYNLAKLILETRGEAGVETARYYYDTGRKTYGGPEDRFLEEKLK